MIYLFVQHGKMSRGIGGFGEEESLVNMAMDFMAMVSLFTSLHIWGVFIWLTSLVQTVLYMRWWCNDNENTRKRLWIVQAISIGYCFVQLITFFAYSISVEYGMQLYLLMNSGT